MRRRIAAALLFSCVVARGSGVAFAEELRVGDGSLWALGAGGLTRVSPAPPIRVEVALRPRGIPCAEGDPELGRHAIEALLPPEFLAKPEPEATDGTRRASACSDVNGAALTVGLSWPGTLSPATAFRALLATLRADAAAAEPRERSLRLFASETATIPLDRETGDWTFIVEKNESTRTTLVATWPAATSIAIELSRSAVEQTCAQAGLPERGPDAEWLPGGFRHAVVGDESCIACAEFWGRVLIANVAFKQPGDLANRRVAALLERALSAVNQAAQATHDAEGARLDAEIRERQERWAAQEKRALELLQRGRSLNAAQRFAEAVPLLREAEQLIFTSGRYPEEVEIAKALAEAQAGAGDPLSAAGSLDSAILIVQRKGTDAEAAALKGLREEYAQRDAVQRKQARLAARAKDLQVDGHAERAALADKVRRTVGEAIEDPELRKLEAMEEATRARAVRSAAAALKRQLPKSGAARDREGAVLYPEQLESARRARAEMMQGCERGDLYECMGVVHEIGSSPLHPGRRSIAAMLTLMKIACVQGDTETCGRLVTVLSSGKWRLTTDAWGFTPDLPRALGFALIACEVNGAYCSLAADFFQGGSMRLLRRDPALERELMQHYCGSSGRKWGQYACEQLGL